MLNRVKSPEVMGKHSWAETGTAIFAFLNVLSASIGLLVTLFVLSLYIYEAITHTDVIDTFMSVACLTANIVAITSFIFSIVLYLGVIRKIPSFVLSYFIFGVIMLLSIVGGLVAFYQQDTDSYVHQKAREALFEYLEPVIYGTIGICVMYALLLTMICRTWCLMSSRRSNDHKLLVNDYYESEWRNN